MEGTAGAEGDTEGEEWGGGVRKKRRRRRRVCRYIGEGERWIVVFGVRFCLEVGIKIKFHWKSFKKKRRPRITCSSCKQILFNCEIINHVESWNVVFANTAFCYTCSELTDLNENVHRYQWTYAAGSLIESEITTPRPEDYIYVAWRSYRRFDFNKSCSGTIYTRILTEAGQTRCI